MPEVPPTPRPRKRAATKRPQEPVTPDTTDTVPDRDAPEGDLSAAAARAAGKPPPKVTEPPKRAGRATRADRLQDSLAELLALPSLAYAATGDTWAASHVAERAPIMAEAWVELGKENPAVMRVLQKITTTSAWGGVIMATGGTLLPLAIHHNLLPDLGFPLGGSGEGGAPIVPPPPAGGPTPPGFDGSGVVGRQPPPPHGHTNMTPPLKPDQPPGVVTVAGTNNQAAG